MSASASYKIPASQPAYSSRRVRTVAHSDIKMIHTSDGGDIVYEGGLLALDDGLFNAVYLSLFGGNSDDSGQSATRDKQWWGNVIAENDLQKMTSETQYVLQTIACTPANLRKLDADASRDLAPLVSSGIATEASASTRITGPNAVLMTVVVIVDGTRHEYQINQQWGA